MSQRKSTHNEFRLVSQKKVSIKEKVPAKEKVVLKTFPAFVNTPLSIYLFTIINQKNRAHNIYDPQSGNE